MYPYILRSIQARANAMARDIHRHAQALHPIDPILGASCMLGFVFPVGNIIAQLT